MPLPAFREGTPIRHVAVVALGLLLALLVVLAAIVGSSRGQDGVFARPLLDGTALADAAMERYRRLGKVDDATLALGRSALIRAPILATPLVLKGADALNKGDVAEALRLADEAVRRDPRSRPGRTLRMLACLQASRPACAIADIDRLLALAPGQWPVLFDLLERIALDPVGRPALEAHLRRGPLWRGGFIQRLSSVSGVDSAIVFALTNAATAGAEASAARNTTADQTALLASLLKRRDYERAYLAWIGFLPESALGDVAFIYDGRFRNRPGPLPFNWALADNDKGLAEFLPGGGVSVDFYASRGGTSLVRQTAILPPGYYRLSVNAAGKIDPETATLTWTIQCDGTPRPFASLPMNGLGDKPETRTLDFTVQSGCGAQTFNLRGQAAVTTGETHIVLHGLTITAVK